MIVLAYSKVSRESLTTSIGLPQYSYYFVLEKFRPILERLGEVIEVSTQEQIAEQTRHIANCAETAVLFSFTPPQDIPEGVACPVICVLAWEFSNIPYETWDDNANNDWRVALKKVQAVITLSRHTKSVIQQTMGPDFPVHAIPVPLWDRFQHLRDTLPGHIRKNACLTPGNVSIFDTGNFVIGPDEMTLAKAHRAFALPAWDQTPIQMDFFGYSLDSGRLVGFYEPESWGLWSRLPSPWLVLPVCLQGSFVVEFEAAGFGNNAGHAIDVILGDQRHPVVLQGNFTTHRIEVSSSNPVQTVGFGGLLKSLVGTSDDHRTLGMGLRWLRIMPNADVANNKPGLFERMLRRPMINSIVGTVSALKKRPPTPTRTVSLSGVVYTMLFNPVDQRKNWQDILSAFCHAFRDCADVVLVLKMSHKHVGSFLGKLTYLLEQMQPFQCRVIALHGFMDDEALSELIGETTYYLNASLCEGLCMPIMEFMSSGVPGVATRNTAMEDYVTPDSHFIVESSLAPTIWPQDPRQLIRTLQYRVNWESLEAQLRASYQTAIMDPDRYHAMSRHALDIMADYCSDEIVYTDVSSVVALATRP
jgi:glycosyltransferase involved in cell wall biosynthesis